MPAEPETQQTIKPLLEMDRIKPAEEEWKLSQKKQHDESSTVKGRILDVLVKEMVDDEGDQGRGSISISDSLSREGKGDDVEAVASDIDDLEREEAMKGGLPQTVLEVGLMAGMVAGASAASEMARAGRRMTITASEVGAVGEHLAQKGKEGVAVAKDLIGEMEMLPEEIEVAEAI